VAAAARFSPSRCSSISFGVSNPHVAIGTSAFAVLFNANQRHGHHARQGRKWRCGLMYARPESLAHSSARRGKDGRWTEAVGLFALVMIIVGVSMLRRRGDPGNAEQNATPRSAEGVGIGWGRASSPASSESAGIPH